MPALPSLRPSGRDQSPRLKAGRALQLLWLLIATLAPAGALPAPDADPTVQVRLRIPALPKVKMSVQIGENRFYRVDNHAGRASVLDLGALELGWQTFRLHDVRFLDGTSAVPAVPPALSCSGGFALEAAAGQRKARELALSMQLDPEGRLRCTIR